MRDTIEMAREAGADFYIDNAARVPAHWKFTAEQIKAFEALVRADERDRAMRENAYVQAEREACAKEAESWDCHLAAAEIRNRGNT